MAGLTHPTISRRVSLPWRVGKPPFKGVPLKRVHLKGISDAPIIYLPLISKFTLMITFSYQFLEPDLKPDIMYIYYKIIIHNTS